MKFQTRLVHAGQKPDPLTGALVPSIVTATTFKVKDPGAPQEYEYARVSSPTRKTLENCFADVEGGSFALALASGCSAMHLLCQLLKPGDTVLAEEDLYGGTLRLLKHLEAVQGIKLKTADLSRIEESFKALPTPPAMIWVESPTNPLLKIIDIENLSKAKSPNSLLVVDNTFAGPCFQRPLELGADLVVYSATKYIGGHSDCMAGLIAGRRKDLEEPLRFFSKTLGPVLSPFDSYLLLRSLKTLWLRMRKHEENAFRLARFLKKHEKVERVLYPGLEDSPGHDIACRQMSGFGGMLGFFVKGGSAQALCFLKNLKVFTVAESLGAVESLAEHPLSMTHASHSGPGIKDNLIRLSVGIESSKDLEQDLRQALDQVGGQAGGLEKGL